MSLDTSTLRPEVRSRLNAVYARVSKDASDGFVYSGEPRLVGVPKWVVKAWVLATCLGHPVVEACAAAHYGQDTMRRARGAPDWPGWRDARAWSWRLARIAEAGAAAHAVRGDQVAA